MLEIEYSTFFLKAIRRLPDDILEEVYEKVEMFKDKENHQRLKVHKLSGKLKDKYSFSVDFYTRIVFEYKDKHTAILLDFGNHDIYK